MKDWRGFACAFGSAVLGAALMLALVAWARAMMSMVMGAQ